MPDSIDTLKDLIGEVVDLSQAAALLDWDQQTYMPRGGAEARSSQVATLRRLAHERFTDPELADALEAARSAAADMDPDSDSARLVWRVGYDLEKQMRVPADHVAEFARVTTLAQQAWMGAKQASDFAAFKPDLARVIELRREYAGFFEPYEHIYDPLLDDFERGMKSSQVAAVFSELRTTQTALVKAIAQQPPIDDSVMHRHFPVEGQRAFGERVIRAFGYDFERGRQDESSHPFTTSFGSGDVRITTRFQEDFLPTGLFATLHEAGHGMYEQGFPASLARTPLADGASLGMHESQSRLWENLVGRSQSFWTRFYPELQRTFPGSLQDVHSDAFYRAINKVQPSLIRVEADEATYNLHIMVRFELERAVLSGDLAIDDLPLAWNDAYEAYLGIRPPDDRLGVLQDIHWSSGYIGYFPTYALGNLIACQIWEKIASEMPDLDDQIGRGAFEPLLSWLRQHIHRHGAKYEPVDLLRRVTGQDLTAEPYLRYLQAKFGRLYGLA